MWSPISSDVQSAVRPEWRHDENTGAKVASNASGAHKANLRLDFAEQVDEHGSVRVGCVGEQTGIFDLIYHVGTIGENLVFHSIEIVADNKRLEFHAETVGKHTAFGEEFEAHISNATFVELAIYYQIVIVLCNIAGYRLGRCR